MPKQRPSALHWVETTRTSFNGETVHGLMCTFHSMRYDDGTSVTVDAWPGHDGSTWFVGDQRAALDHHTGPQGAVGVAVAMSNLETLFDVRMSGDFAVYRLISTDRGRRPPYALLDEAAYVVCAASALFQRARYQPFAIKIS